MAKESLQIDGQKGMNSQMAHESQRDGWTEETYIRKNSDRNNHYDWTRHNLNFAVKDGMVIPLDQEEKLEDAYHRRMKEIGGKEYKSGASNAPYTHAILIIGGDKDHEILRKLAFGDQEVDFGVSADHPVDNCHVVRQKGIEDYAIAVWNWAAKEYGAKNILACDVHLDESNPHIHLDVMPTALKKTRGRASKNKPKKMKEQLAFKEFFGAKYSYGGNKKTGYTEQYMLRGTAYSRLHDTLYEEVGKKFGLERGDTATRQHLNKADYAALEEIRKEKERLDAENEKKNLEIQRKNDDVKRLDEVFKKRQKSLDLQKQEMEKAVNRAQEAADIRIEHEEKTREADKRLSEVSNKVETLKTQQSSLLASVQALKAEQKASTLLGKLWEMLVAAVKAILRWEHLPYKVARGAERQEVNAVYGTCQILPQLGLAKDSEDAGKKLLDTARKGDESAYYGWSKDNEDFVMDIARQAQQGLERGVQRGGGRSI